MRGKTPLKVAIGLTTAAMLVSACGGGGGGDNNAASQNDSGGTLRIYASEPAFLVPTAANDDPSIQVIRNLYRGLISYNDKTGKPENDLAESIESTDNIHWTIKVKQGYTFTNGEPVNADSFIRSWNYTAYGPNAQNNAYFVSRIKGAAEMASKDSTVKELSGVKKVDDYTFTVELTGPFVGFPSIIGYSGFFPVAEACLADFKACNEKPIGNGPYMMDGSWQHDQEIDLVKNPDWKGTAGKADRLEFKIFTDVNAGYSAFQGGELDVMYTLPPEKVKEAEAALGDRLIQGPSDSFTYLGMPTYDPQFKDPKIHQAFSYAIDRQAIIDAVLDGAATPATGWVSPNFDGYRPDVCTACKQDVAKAKQLLAEAGGWKGGKLVLWANAGAGHDKWLQAVGDQIKKALGIDYELKVDLQFPEYLAKADGHKLTGPFRLGWGPDYPVLETYLAPLYGTDASSNDSGYSNPQFDSLVKQGDGASSLEEGIKFYQQAEDILAQDMPVIPMWFGKYNEAIGTNVDKYVRNTISGRPRYDEITVKNKG